MQANSSILSKMHKNIVAVLRPNITSVYVQEFNCSVALESFLFYAPDFFLFNHKVLKRYISIVNSDNREVFQDSTEILLLLCITPHIFQGPLCAFLFPAEMKILQKCSGFPLTVMKQVNQCLLLTIRDFPSLFPECHDRHAVPVRRQYHR